MPRRTVPIELGRLAAGLGRMPLFADIPADELERTVSRGQLLTFEPDEVIVSEGALGLGFYIVLEGRVRVDRDAMSFELGPGEFFGEIALIERMPRLATVTADGPATCFGMLRTHFREMLVRNPRVALRALDIEAERLSGEVGSEAKGG
jgi:CRP-like cAMP-binding protein